MPDARRHFSAAAGGIGVIGVVGFAVALGVLHATERDIDVLRNLVSEFARSDRGALFVISASVHGVGNLLVATALYFVLRRGSSTAWGSLLYGMSALGILLAAIFPTDLPGESSTITGRIHWLTAMLSFPIEWLSLVLLSRAMANTGEWQRDSTRSLALTRAAGVSLVIFAAAYASRRWAGLAERLALGCFMLWEGWAGYRLWQRQRETAV